MGNEDPDVHLFRCIQSMNPAYAFNTCYTGGETRVALGVQQAFERARASLVSVTPSSICVRLCASGESQSLRGRLCPSGIVKLEEGDYLELLIPRPTANVSLEGDSTFLGAFKLA